MKLINLLKKLFLVIQVLLYILNFILIFNYKMDYPYQMDGFPNPFKNKRSYSPTNDIEFEKLKIIKFKFLLKIFYFIIIIFLELVLSLVYHLYSLN